MIKYYNRQNKSYETEKIVGEKALKWTYETPLGRSFLELLIKRKLFSSLYGSYCDSTLSKRKIYPFIKNFQINMEESQLAKDQFNNFNDFFSRKLKLAAREFSINSEHLISPGDGRLITYDSIDLRSLVVVKGVTYSFKELIEDDPKWKSYEGGTCLILRLCPTDYHRFHFIDSGICGETHKIKGSYYSVNPIALNKIKKLYCQNKREWSVLKSDNFGDVLYVEVGATCVGSIIQSYKESVKVNKGDEKGYFKFGGSTVILFFQKGSIKIDEDICQQSKLGFETLVKLGEKIGTNI